MAVPGLSMVKNILSDAWAMTVRHKVLAGVFTLLTLVLLGFGTYVGFPQMVVLVAPIAAIGYGFLKIVARGRTLTPASEARWIVAASVVGVVLTAGLIQAVPYGRAHDNPPVTGEPQWADPQTRELMVRACYGCHSNEVEYPPYASIAPLSWMVQSHVDEGRGKVNFSEFATNKRGMDDTIEVILEGSMPPAYYTRFGRHPEAKLTDAEIQALVDGLRRTPGFSERNGGRDKDRDRDGD